MLAGHSSTPAHERIGRYEVLRKIATGGMAELFLAKQVGMEGFEKVVAIKRILAHLAYDEEFINMFRDEARIVAKLSHPNIVQIYDLGKSGDTYFIAMEYIPGRNLSSVAKKAKQKGQGLPPAYIARCLAQACEGLYYAHTRKDIDGLPLAIVHRDVSPQNIIVSFSGTVKLVDFGIAKAATKIAHTRAGVLKGKYAYMSPEQIRGEETDARSDLFAAGIVLYELLCGRRPFEKDNSIQTLKAIVQDQHVDCRVLNPDIPDGLAEIIDHALTKDPSTRFQNAQELQIALEDFVQSSGARCNNITISKWITDLFQEELTRERGGTVVFQGIGEVILPDLLREAAPVEPPAEVSSSAELEAKEPEPGSPGDATDNPPMGLARGRGGGSVEPRPPIPAPSNSMLHLDPSHGRGTGISRQGLIEEGVIERDLVPHEDDVWDDDATVHLEDAPESKGAQEGEAAPGAPAPYSDDKTELGPKSPVPEEPEERLAAQTTRPLPRRGSEAPTIAPLPPAPPISREQTAPRGESDVGAPFLAPLEEVSEEAFAASDDPWDEATIGYPDGAPPVHDFEGSGPEAVSEPVASDRDPTGHDLRAALAKASQMEPDTSEMEEGELDAWGELDDDFEADHTMRGPDLWDDKTASNDGYLPQAAIPSPVVVRDHDAVVFVDEDEDEASEPDFLGDATITQRALSDTEGDPGDATLSVRAIDEALLNASRRSPSDFNDDRTISSAHILVDDEDVEPLDGDDELDVSLDGSLDGSLEVSLGGAEEAEDDGGWLGDATIAGGPAMLRGDSDLDAHEEPELPVPRSNQDVNRDARTLAGVSSDFLDAGIDVPVGGAYDPLKNERDLDFETRGAPPPQSAPAKRGQERLGAIRLNRMAVANTKPREASKGFGSEEVTEGEVSLFDQMMEPELPTVDPDAFDLEATTGASERSEIPLVEPSPLEDPFDEPYVPGPSMAKDEYSALLAPSVPAPLNPAQPLSGPFGIGSTNVPPANISFSQVLSKPMGSPVRNASLVALPRNASAPQRTGRSASIIGRQIREVVRADGSPGTSATPPPEPAAPMAFEPAPLAPRQELPVGLQAPPPAPRSGRGRAILTAALLVLAVALLSAVAFVAMQTFGPKEPHLIIKTTPPNASVFVNDTLQPGRTPITITGLQPGVQYNVRLELAGHEVVSQPVTLHKNRPMLWPVALVPQEAQPAPAPPPAEEP